MSFLSQPITLQSLFGSKRMIGPIIVQLAVTEETNDTLTITKQPVQTGSSISDHAYKEPTAFSMTILQQNNTTTTNGIIETFTGAGSGGLSQIYQTFLQLQTSRTPFNVITPKRIYKNMLMGVIRQNTDRHTENILSLNVSFQEVIIVSVGSVVVPKYRQKKNSTQSTQNTGQKSALLSLTQGILPNTIGVSK